MGDGHVRGGKGGMWARGQIQLRGKVNTRRGKSLRVGVVGEGNCSVESYWNGRKKWVGYI